MESGIRELVSVINSEWVIISLLIKPALYVNYK
jgi:hypothetical protein